MSSHATKLSQTMLVADEAWCALALLHREHEGKESFSAREILDRVKAEQCQSRASPGSTGPYLFAQRGESRTQLCPVPYVLQASE